MFKHHYELKAQGEVKVLRAHSGHLIYKPFKEKCENFKVTFSGEEMNN